MEITMRELTVKTDTTWDRVGVVTCWSKPKGSSKLFYILTMYARPSPFVLNYSIFLPFSFAKKRQNYRNWVLRRKLVRKEITSVAKYAHL